MKTKNPYESMEEMSNMLKKRLATHSGPLYVSEVTARRCVHTAGPEVLSRINIPAVCADHSAHITPADGNIFLDLGFLPEEAKILKEKSEAKTQAKKDTEKK
ncbi:MAG TPA: hypothetical protein VIY47_10650 [Ignavibacteriaceae bacterium]